MGHRSNLRAWLLALSAVAAACGGGPDLAASQAPPPQAPPSIGPVPNVPLSSLPQIEPQPILDRIKVLASDQFEGRAPGTKGEELTVQYLESEFKSLGLKPGNTDGTYIQRVPLVGITATETRPMTIAKNGVNTTLKWRDEVVAWSKHVADSASIADSDVIFAGYGVEAPEFK